MGSSGDLGRVMLVDDEVFDQKMYRRVLERSGLTEDIVSFFYAEQALDHLADPANHAPDLILLDINMPRMNGFEFLESMAEKFGADLNTVVVVMLTTPLNAWDHARVTRSSYVKAFFDKPLRAENLAAAVELVSANRRAANVVATRSLAGPRLFSQQTGRAVK